MGNKWAFILGITLASAYAFPVWAQPDDSTGDVPTPTSPEGGERGEVEARKLSKLPKQTKFVEADYPAEAAEKKIEADVVLLLDISDRGKVTAVSIAEPATVADMGFEDAALIAANGFEFEPAELDGKPIAVQLAYKYRFVLKDEPQPAVPEPLPAETPAPGGRATTAPTKAQRAAVVNFQGQLLERGTRLKLGGVVVTVFRDEGLDEPIGYEATSDDEGRFQFFDLDAGPWKVLVQQPGYFPYRTTEDVVAGALTEVVYYVEKGQYNPYDVVVKASRPRKEVSRTSISAKEIDKIPGTAGDPLAVIQNFAGIARTPNTGGQPVVRGSAPEETQIFIDGIAVPNVFHFGGLRSVVPIGMLDGIDFYPGNFGTEYGRAVGGIIDVKTKDKTPQKFGGYVDVSILDAGLYLEIPVSDKFHIAMAGRRSHVDAIIEAAVPDNASVNVVSAPRYYDYQLLASYRPSRAHKFRIFHFGADDRLQLLFQNPSELDLDVSSGDLSLGTNFYRTVMSYRYTPSETFSNDLRISSGRDKFNFALGKDLSFDLDIYQSQIRDAAVHRLGQYVSLNYGVDFLFQKATGFINLPPPPKEGQPEGMGGGGNFDLSNTLTSEFSDTYWSPAVYLEAEVRPNDKLRLYPGVRLEHFSRISSSMVSPRLTGRYAINDKTNVRAGVGFFGQEPFFDETNPAFGNPNLKAEKAMHYSVGVEHKPREYISVNATLFYKDMWSMVAPTRATAMSDGMVRPLFYDNQG